MLHTRLALEDAEQALSPRLFDAEWPEPRFVPRNGQKRSGVKQGEWRINEYVPMAADRIGAERTRQAIREALLARPKPVWC